MQTGADRKLLAISINAAKLTAKELAKALERLATLLESGAKPTYQATYADFSQPNGASLININPQKSEMENVDELARQNDVNASIKKNQGTDTHYLCLQGNMRNILKMLDDSRKRSLERRELVKINLAQARAQSKSSHTRDGRTQEKDRTQ